MANKDVSDSDIHITEISSKTFKHIHNNTNNNNNNEIKKMKGMNEIKK